MARKSRYLGYMKELQKISKHEKTSTKAVSYTHLTLPTKLEV